MAYGNEKKNKRSGSEKKQLGAAEAIIFASGDPVSISHMAQVLEISESDMDELIDCLMEEYNQEGRGIRLVKLDGYVQMCTASEYGETVRKTLEMRRNTPLSQAAMEVLAVIAYNQPVTKAYVEQVRGVDCSAVISGLSTKGLVEEKGRLELPGRPLLYGTTPDFLRCLNIHSLQELPPLPQKQEAEEEKTAVPPQG